MHLPSHNLRCTRHARAPILATRGEGPINADPSKFQKTSQNQPYLLTYLTKKVHPLYYSIPNQKL